MFAHGCQGFADHRGQVAYSPTTVAKTLGWPQSMTSSDQLLKPCRKRPVYLFLHMACTTLWQSLQGIKAIHHKGLSYCAITMYRHLFLNWYLYSLNIHDSNKTLKAICRYIVIAQDGWPNTKRLDGSAAGNTYTGPDDVMLCAKLKVYASLRVNQTKGWGRSSIKLTFHLCVIRMWTMNVNDECN